MVGPWRAARRDAAGMVSPATGEGIRLAFQFGRRRRKPSPDIS